jgi:superfamily II DNA or RNA helicase
MVQTLSREASLKSMPSIDLLVIDKAHHAVADSYMRIINTVRDNNAKAMIYGVTATPNRGDKKGLKAVFSNVADQIQIAELIATGHLVCPKNLY